MAFADVPNAFFSVSAVIALVEVVVVRTDG